MVVDLGNSRDTMDAIIFYRKLTLNNLIIK